MEAYPLNQKPFKKGTLSQLVLRSLVGFVMIIVLLLVSAGKVDYWQAWLYTGMNLLLLLANLWSLRHNPELIEERLKPGEGMKGWDRVYYAVTTPLYFFSLVVAGLDVGRFGWTGTLAWPVYGLAVVIYLAGQAIFLWAKRTNRFFSTVVRIQAERGQTVCREGPYRYIRHPGYAGGILFMLAGALMLGSLWAMAVEALACAFLVVRAALEDRTLQVELPGYAEYARQVRFRVLPGVW